MTKSIVKLVLITLAFVLGCNSAGVPEGLSDEVPVNDDAIYELVKAVNSDVYKSLKLQSEVERNSLNLPYISKQVVSSGTNNFIKVHTRGGIYHVLKIYQPKSGGSIKLIKKAIEFLRQQNYSILRVVLAKIEEKANLALI